MSNKEELLKEGAKFDDGKARFDLLSPPFLFGTAEVLRYGAVKYADRNWEKGISYGRVFAGIMRHLWAWWGGEDRDPETGMSHLWHSACGIQFLISYEAWNMGEEFDDRPHH